MNVNAATPKDTSCKTTSPGLHDLLWARTRALQSLRTMETKKQIIVMRPAADHGAGNREKIRGTLFKTDVTKALKEAKIRRMDRKYRGALGVNLINGLSGDCLWEVVYVDDFMLIPPGVLVEDLKTANTPRAIKGECSYQWC